MQRCARRAGFTLIELMMVVVIMSVLATIALPRYRSYVYRAKTTEAVGFLAEIKSHQESYRADFGQYCNVSGAITNYYPDNTPTTTYRPWPTSAEWQQLGAAPPGAQVLFRYATVAGAPGGVDTPSAHGFVNNLGYQGIDFWFASRAIGDLNGDGVQVIFESYSHGQGLYCSQAKGWE